MARASFQLIRDIGRAIDRWQADDGLMMAAATAYYVGLSFFPLLIVLIAGMSWFLQSTHLGQDAQRQVLEAISQNMSPALADYVGQVLSQLQAKSAVGGPIGLATMLLTSLAAFAQLDAAFDRIGNTESDESRGIVATLVGVLVQRGRAFILLLALATIVVVVFLAGVTLTAVQSHTATVLDVGGWLWSSLQIAITFVINVGVFTLMHQWLPKTPLRFGEAFRGALVTAVAWEIGRQVLSLYLVHSDYASTYGVIGAFLGILLWCYYAVAIILVGAEYIQVVRADRRRARREAAGS